MLADELISSQAIATTAGRPWPPYSGTALSAGQPPSTNWPNAALNPGGVVTVLSGCQTQPCLSPTLFSGASTSAQNRADSPSICSTRSIGASEKPGRLASFSISSTSFRRNRCSRTGG